MIEYEDYYYQDPLLKKFINELSSNSPELLNLLIKCICDIIVNYRRNIHKNILHKSSHITPQYIDTATIINKYFYDNPRVKISIEYIRSTHYIKKLFEQIHYNNIKETIIYYFYAYFLLQHNETTPSSTILSFIKILASNFPLISSLINYVLDIFTIFTPAITRHSRHSLLSNCLCRYESTVVFLSNPPQIPDKYTQYPRRIFIDFVTGKITIITA